MEKVGRVLGAVAGAGIVALWISLSLHPNSGGPRFILIASSMIVAAVIGIFGALLARPSLLLIAFAVSLPSALYFFLVETIYRGIGYLTPLLLVSAALIYLPRRAARPA